MKQRIIATALFALFAFSFNGPTHAQAPATVKLCVQTGNTCVPVNSSTPLPVNASVSASITGFPGTTQTTGTPISVTSTAGGVTGTLPAGTEVVASNVGSTNSAFCKLGASASTSDQQIPPNSWFGFTVGSNTQITCITSTSTTTVNLVGGSGLPTGAGGGGGSGGGGGGAVFGPTAVGSAAANPPVLMGGTANAGATGNVQVAKVSAAGLVSVDGSAVTQPVSVASSTPEGSLTDAPATVPTSSTSASIIALLKALTNVANAPAQLAVNVTPTDCSGTITTGGTAQAAIAAQTTLHGFTIANIDASAGSGEPLNISFTGTAAANTAGSYPLAAPTATTFAGLTSFTAPPGFGTNHAVSIIGTTTGHKFSCTWW